jgi:hypothetical protein
MPGLAGRQGGISLKGAFQTIKEFLMKSMRLAFYHGML